MTDIVEGYLEEVLLDNDKLCRNTMYQVVGNITTCDEVGLSAIDYVTSSLVNETCEVLQNIISKCIESKLQDEATKLLLSARNFLKHQFADHVSILFDNICYHSVQYGLSKSSPNRTNHN